MMEGKLSVSVIICAYTDKRWHDITEAIQSIISQTLPAFEIILVIDHNQQLFERARAYFPDTVKIIENSESRGLSGARNSGITCAKGEIIAFLDDDEIASPEWIKYLVEGYNDPQIFSVGGAIQPLWLCPAPGWFPLEFSWTIGGTSYVMPKRDAFVRNLFGGNMSYRKKVFNEIGGFNTSLGLVGERSAKRILNNEDTELCIRLSQRWPGAKVLYRPYASVQHKVQPVNSFFKYFIKRCFHEGRSKAYMSKLTTTKQGLSSERSYLLQVIPQGFVQGILDSLLHLQPKGLLQAGAILIGVSVTVCGYVIERLENISKMRPSRTSKIIALDKLELK